MEGMMTKRTVTIGIVGREDVKARMCGAFAGKQQGMHITFETPDLLWKVLTQKRWELLRILAGAGPVSIREAARLAGRDVKAIHGDVHALLEAGLLEKAGAGIEFPYDAVQVRFTLPAA